MKIISTAILIFVMIHLSFGQLNVDSLKSLLAGAKQDTIRIKLYDDIGNSYKTNNQDSSIFFLQKGVALAQQKKYTYQQTSLLSDLAYAYYRNGELEKATQANFDCMTLAKQLNDDTLASPAYHNLGLIFTDKEDYTKAIAYLKKAVATNERYHKERALNANLNPLGGVYFALTQYDSALYYFKQAFTLSQKLKSERQLAIASSNIGAIYYMKNDFQTAIDYYKKSLEVYKKNNNLSNMPVALSNLGEAYIAQNNFTEGLKLYDEALMYCEKAKENNFRSEMYKMYADAYVKKGDYKLAFEYQVKFKSAKDSLTKKLYNKNVAEAETKYETKEKEAKIAQQKLELFRQQSWLIALIISLLALVAFAYLYYNNYRSKQKAILDAAIIREHQLGLNAVIEAQEAERKRISKDLHDGIAQELVALKLGFNRLQNKIEKIAPDEAVNMGQLTNQLNDSCTEVRNIAHVMMPPNLETSGLVSALEMLLRNSLQHSHIQTEFEHFDLPERLNDKTEVGLYRIAQELLNNILKHAQASKVILQLYKAGNQLIMRFEDNGKGFDFEAAKNKSSMGLLNILSRVNNLGGTFFSEEGAVMGTVSTVRIPL